MGRVVVLQARYVSCAVIVGILSACSADEQAASTNVPVETAQPIVSEATGLRYDREFPVLEYSQRSPSNAVAQLAEQISANRVTLATDPQRGYLQPLLNALEIDPASQVLVFSKTSLQVEGVTAATPRAIYFNDDTYVAWVPGAASIEIASYDAELGPVFHTVLQSEPAALERRFGLCLNCHDSLSLTGGGVPRFITGSGYIGKDGSLVAHEGWILTSDRTALRSRWGGWYVSGMHGEQVHLGNIAVDSVYDLENLEALRNGNYEDLRGLLDTSPYLTDKSDIVALLVLEHQTTVQNAIVRLNWDFRQGREFDIEALVGVLLMAGAPEFASSISGTAGFEAAFERRAIRDARGRSLRDFDLESRLFTYPLSYVIYSDAIAHLPQELLRELLIRIEAELTGRTAQFEDLPGDAESRLAAWEILSETRPDFAAMVAPQ
jgi:hypothetical protein